MPADCIDGYRVTIDHRARGSIVAADDVDPTRSRLSETTLAEGGRRRAGRTKERPAAARRRRIDDGVDGDTREATVTAIRSGHSNTPCSNHDGTASDRTVDDEVKRCSSSAATTDAVTCSSLASSARSTTSAHQNAHSCRSRSRDVHVTIEEDLAPWSRRACEARPRRARESHGSRESCRTCRTCRTCVAVATIAAIVTSMTPLTALTAFTAFTVFTVFTMLTPLTLTAARAAGATRSARATTSAIDGHEPT